MLLSSCYKYVSKWCGLSMPGPQPLLISDFGCCNSKSSKSTPFEEIPLQNKFSVLILCFGIHLALESGR